jgi:co-chaperonin GroES (HSP10)
MKKFKAKITARPLGNSVVVQREAIAEQSDGGIIMPTEVLEKRVNEGHVVSIGSKVEEVSEGDYIIFGEYTAKTVQAGGMEFVIISEDDIYCVLEGR